MSYTPIEQRKKTTNGYVPVAERKNIGVAPIKPTVWDVIKGMPKAAVDVYKPLIQPEINAYKNVVEAVKNPKVLLTRFSEAMPDPNAILTAKTPEEKKVALSKLSNLVIGASSGLQRINGITDELALQYAKEMNALKIEKDLIKKGVSEIDAKTISPKLAATKTPNEVRQILLEYGAPTPQAPVKQLRTAETIKQEIQALQDTLSYDQGALNIAKRVSRTTGFLPEVTGKSRIQSLTGSGKMVNNSLFGQKGDAIAETELGTTRDPQEAADAVIRLRQQIKDLRQELKTGASSLEPQFREIGLEGDIPKTIQQDLEVIANKSILSQDRYIKLNNFLEKKGFVLDDTAELGIRKVTPITEQAIPQSEKITANPHQLQVIRDKMERELVNYYSGGGMMTDTATVDRLRNANGSEIEAEFKKVFKVESSKHYFDEIGPAKPLKFSAEGIPLSTKSINVQPSKVPFVPSTPEEKSLMRISEQQGYIDPRIEPARVELEKRIADMNLKKWNNVREAMNFPPLEQMSFDQIKQLDEIFGQYNPEDEFLTTRQLQTINNTKLTGMRTIREVLTKLRREQHVAPSDVISAKPHPWMHDTLLYNRGGPFWRLVLDTINPLYLRAEARKYALTDTSDELIRAARKSRQRTMGQKLIPTDDIIVEYHRAEPEDKEIIAQRMTPEEYKAAQFQQEYFRSVYDWKLKEELEKKLTNAAEDNISRFKDIYYHHTPRPFLEAMKDGGFKEAFNETIKQFDQEEAIANILNEKTGDILPYDKWVAAFQFRTGKLVPSKNAALAFNSYVNMIEKAKLFNEAIPELMIYAHALGPRLTTSTGLEMDDTLQMGLRKWINTKKGRIEKQIITPGSKADWALRTGIQLVRLRDLALNIGIQLASPFGEQAGNIIMLRSNYPKAIRRMFTPQAKVIADKYRNFVGEKVWKTIMRPDMNIKSQLVAGFMAMFSSATRKANLTFLLGNMTREEFMSATISEKRLADLRIEMGRFRNVHDAQSVFNKSVEGKIITQYKQWAIPTITTTAGDFGTLAKMLRQKGGTKEAFKSREFKELFTMTLLSATLILGGLSFYTDLSKKGKNRTLVEDIAFKVYRDSMSMIGALDPNFMIGFAKPRLLTFFVDMATNLRTLAILERYKTGAHKGELKGPRMIANTIMPVAISQFFGEPKEETTTSSKVKIPAGLPQLPSLKGTLPTLPKLPSL